MSLFLQISREQQVIGPESSSNLRSIMFSEVHRMQLSGLRGSVRTDLIRLKGLGLAFGQVASTGHEIDLHESESISFLLPREGTLDIRVTGRDYRLMPGHLMAFRPTTRTTRATPNLRGAFLASTLLVSMARLRTLGTRLGVKGDGAFAVDGFDLSGPTGRYLCGTLAQLSEDLILRPSTLLPHRVATEIGHLIDEQIAEMMGAGPEQRASRTVLPALHRVRLAEEILHAESDEPLSMLDLAERLGISLRSLQLAFADVHGMGPRGVLNAVRLEKARHRLVASDDESQVTEIAMDCGFSHLSRFAQAYARTYGEKPSETLARRRAPQGRPGIAPPMQAGCSRAMSG